MPSTQSLLWARDVGGGPTGPSAVDRPIDTLPEQSAASS